MYANFLSDFIATLPITVVAVAGIVVVLYDSFRNDAPELPWIAGIGTLAAFVIAVTQLNDPGMAFNGHFFTGGFAAYVNAVILFGTLGSILLSVPYLRKIDKNFGEVYALMLFAVVGMMVFGNAGSIVTMFVGLETMSLCFYVLTGLVREDKRATESALKFFILSAFSAAFFLYGMAMLFGATGTVMFTEMPALLVETTGAERMYVYVGVGLLLVGLLFKVSAVPFHMWTPDVYQGAPSSITAFISTTAKASAFAAFVIVLAVVLPMEELATRWTTMLAIVAAVTMVVGNVIALRQDNLKRLLAYSWVAHSGYVMAGLAANSEAGYSASMYYLFAYTLMNIGAFGVIAALEWDGKQGSVQTIDSLAGIGYRKPILGVSMGIFMFALIGFPPLAGFIGKYLVFSAAIQGGYTWLAILGVLMSVVSAYYYLRVLVVFWMKDPSTEPQEVRDSSFAINWVVRAVLFICALGLLYLGTLPGVLIELSRGAFEALIVAAQAMP